MPSDGELRAAAAELDFGAVPLQASLTLDLEVTNTGKATRAVAVTIDGPFTAAAMLEVPGGASVKAPVTFAPVALGAASGVLRVGDVEVALRGSGAPACSTSARCRASAFDPTTRACVESALPNGTACSNPCLTAASCQDGTCVGSAAACDDGDACTVDACTEGGTCLRTPRTCPVVDACQVATCDKMTGCGSEPVQDGTSCGAETCAEARVCINGACTTKAKPNAATDCVYADVVAGREHTCVRSVGGDVYCWGQPRGFGGSNGYLSARKEVPELAAPTKLYAAGAMTCGLFDGGVWACAGAAGWTGTFSGPVREFDGPCALLASGEVTCPPGSLDQPDGGYWGAAGAVGLANIGDSICIAFDDRTAGCRGRGGTHPGVPVTFDDVPQGFFVPGTYPNTLCGLLPGGKLQCLGSGSAMVSSATLADAGVVTVGGSNRFVCWADASKLWCHDTFTGGFGAPREVPMPAPVKLITQHGERHACALTTTNEVYCWGGNDRGQLGDRSPQPRGMVELVAPAPIERLAASEGTTLVLAGPELWSHGAELAKLDGGLGTGPSGAGAAMLGVPPASKGLSIVRNLGCLQLTDGGIACWGGRPSWFDPEPLTAIALPAPGSRPAVCSQFSSLCTVAGGQVLGVGRFAPGPTVPGPSGARQIEGRYVLNLDGGVDVLRYVPMVQDYRGFHVALPRPVTRLSAQLDAAQDATMCGQLDDGRVMCWACDGQGTCQPAVPVAGLFPFTRGLVGSMSFGCALFGANGVRCWGDNMYGQLGRDGPSSWLTALDVAMPEAIEELAASPTHACVRTASKRVWCWGDNTLGQLGFTPMTYTDVPLRVE